MVPLVLSWVRLLLRDGLARERADPAGAPSEYASAEECAEKTRDRVLEATAHQPNASPNEASEADDGSCILCEGFEGVHRGRSTGEINRALSVSD